MTNLIYNIFMPNTVRAAVVPGRPANSENANYEEFFNSACRTYEEAVSTQLKIGKSIDINKYDEAKCFFKATLASFNLARSLFKKMINIYFSGYRTNEYYRKAEEMIIKIDAALSSLKEPHGPQTSIRPAFSRKWTIKYNNDEFYYSGRFKVRYADIFPNSDDADALVNRLNESSMLRSWRDKAFKIKVPGGWEVQAGSFISPENAEVRKDLLNYGPRELYR